MIKFSIGLAIAVFSIILGIYQYSELNQTILDMQTAVDDAMQKRDVSKDIKQRATGIRKTSITTTDAQKFTIERLLDIGSPGMEWRFIGQPLIRGSNRALFRYTFRISGPTTYAQSQALLERMNKLPGFVVYRYCFACTQNPRGTDEHLRMVQIEGYLYAYDANAFYF